MIEKVSQNLKLGRGPELKQLKKSRKKFAFYCLRDVMWSEFVS